MFKLILAAMAASGLAAGADAAVTITQSTVGPDVGAYAGETSIANFDTTAGLTLSNAGIRTGSTPDISAAPFDDATSYLSVQGGGSAVLALGGTYKTLSFYWGSIDKYNTVEFYDKNNTLLGSYTGGDVPAAPANGQQTGGSDNRRVQFSFGSDAATSVHFLSNGNAFELDTIAGTGAVPEPATWALMLAGFGLVGASLRRRNRAVVTA